MQWGLCNNWWKAGVFLHWIAWFSGMCFCMSVASDIRNCWLFPLFTIFSLDHVSLLLSLWQGRLSTLTLLTSLSAEAVTHGRKKTAMRLWALSPVHSTNKGHVPTMCHTLCWRWEDEHDMGLYLKRGKHTGTEWLPPWRPSAPGFLRALRSRRTSKKAS